MAETTMLLTVDEVARELRIARRRVWSMISSGELVSLKIGKSRRVSQAAIAEYIRKLEADAKASA